MTFVLRHLAALLITFCAVAAAAPQSDAVRFRAWRVDDGLSHDRVRAFAQDGQGYLWIGTRDGLNRFDGVRFRVYRHDRADAGSLPDNVVMALATTRDGRLWIGTAGGGLARYDAALDRFDRYRAGSATGLAGDQIRALHVDRDGALWVSSFGVGVQRFDPASGRAADLPFGRPAELTGVHDYVDLPDGGMLFVAGANTWRWNGRDAALVPLFEVAPGVQRVAEHAVRDRDGDLWVALVDGGLARFDPDGRLRRHYGANDGLGSVSITSLLQSGEGELWAGTQVGVARYDRAGDRFLAIRHDAGDRTSPSPEIHTLFEDSGGLVWAGSGTSGIGVHDPDGEAVSVYRRRIDGLPSSRVQAVAVEPGGAFWIGYGDAGVVRYVPGQGVVARHREGPDDLASDAIAALARGRDGALWIGYVASGLARLDANGSLRHYASFAGDATSLPANLINALAMDDAGTLWVATDGGGLASLCDGCTAFERHTNDDGDAFDFAHATTTSVVVARDGTIWFGLFGGGVAHLDPATRKLRRYRAGADGDGPASDVVRSVAIDADGVVWVGSAGGLDRIDVAADGRVRFVAQHGEAWRGREHVVCLAPVARDELWVGTTTGLVRYRPASGALDRPGVFERLDRAGFAAGACEARDGKVYFGGVEGLTAFAPDRLPAPRPLGPVVLTDFLLFNRPVDVRPGAPLARTLAHASQLSLDHRQNVFGFGFAALDFRDPGGVTYRYRLGGLNDDWIPALPGQRDAVFSGVPAGDYRLRVQAARAGVAARETSLEISIAPPPWRSAWAYTVYAAICALMIGALWRRYHRRLAYERSVAAQIRRSEEALRRLNEELESRVASRTADLVATNEALSGTLDRLRDTQQQLVEAAKLASLGGLVAGVAHEINTPLGVCLTAASHLAESSRTTSDRLARGELTRSQLEAYQRNAGEAADLIVRNLGRADRLVRSFKQTAVDQAVDDVRDVDLEEAVRGALTLLGPLLRGTPHHVVVDCPERVIVRAPPGALYQIVSNLVVNAVQHAFAPDTAGTITIAIARDGAGASICVADDGRGMDDAERSRVFEPFFTTRRGQGGTGLGLHIVYTLVTQVLKGRIDCDSMRERGSRFCVRW